MRFEVITDTVAIKTKTRIQPDRRLTKMLVLQISQQWFRGDSLPLHPWTGDAVVIEIVDGASTEVYPAQKIFDASDSMAANCWYNRTNGSFCARVGAAGTNAQTLELFNAANLCSAGSMTQTTQ